MRRNSPILQKKIERIEFTSYERTVEIRPDSKGIRLDVYTQDEEQNVYNIEMQVQKEPNLPKRSRYYHSMIDLDLLEKGEEYSQLRQSYVIFISKEKLGEGYSLPIYTYRYQCKENPEILLEDGTWTIFVNAGCDDQSVSSDLKEFLAFIRTGKTEEGETGLAGKLAEAVETAHANRRWRADYMTYELELKQQFALGKEEGLEKGLQEGHTKGLEEGIKGIVEILRSLGIKDEEIKNQLMEKYALSKEQAESYVGQ